MTPRLYTICIRSARASDLEVVESLLTASQLPLAGVRDAFDDFFVAEADQPGVHALRIVGAIGLERFGSKALLRSAVVTDDWRGRGGGRILVDELLDHARAIGVDELYLLTTTAERFFAQRGFMRIDRA